MFEPSDRNEENGGKSLFIVTLSTKACKYIKFISPNLVDRLMNRFSDERSILGLNGT
jgi:hypothetical protein